MEIKFTVWMNGLEQVFLATSDRRLSHPVTIIAVETSPSSGVLRDAIRANAPDVGPRPDFDRRDAQRTLAALEAERALRFEAEADRSSLLATIARLRGELAELRADGCGMTECGMLGAPDTQQANERYGSIGAIASAVVANATEEMTQTLDDLAASNADATKAALAAALHVLRDQSSRMNVSTWTR